MKKVVLTLTASLACLAAFAQGKIGFQNDSLHLVYYTGNAGGLTGAVSTANMPSTGTLSADLYMGSSSAALQLVSSTTFSATPGKWTAASVIAPFAGGSTVFVMAQIRDSGHAASATLNPTLTQTGSTYATTLGYQYYGWSSEFQFTLGGGVTYPVMWGSAGNWPAGTFDMGGGNMGAIGVSLVPEPTSFAMAGLGMAAMLIFRRRKA